MPSLSHLALRYLVWLVALRFLLGILQSVASLPPSPATGVILAAAPMAEIAYQAVRRATRALVLADWVTIWGLCIGIFVLMQVMLPAALLAPMRAALSTPGGIGQIATIVAATGAMGALFVLIGARAGAAKDG